MLSLLFRKLSSFALPKTEMLSSSFFHGSFFAISMYFLQDSVWIIMYYGVYRVMDHNVFMRIEN